MSSLCFINPQSDRCPQTKRLTVSTIQLFFWRWLVRSSLHRPIDRSIVCGHWKPIKVELEWAGGERKKHYSNSYHADTKHWQFFILFPFWERRFCLESDSKWVHQDARSSINNRDGGEDKKLILIAPIYHFFGFCFHLIDTGDALKDCLPFASTFLFFRPVPRPTIFKVKHLTVSLLIAASIMYSFIVRWSGVE